MVGLPFVESGLERDHTLTLTLVLTSEALANVKVSISVSLVVDSRPWKVKCMMNVASVAVPTRCAWLTPLAPAGASAYHLDFIAHNKTIAVIQLMSSYCWSAD